MKIVVISNLYPPIVRGGAEISTQILVKALRDLGHEVLVVTLSPGSPGRRTRGGEGEEIVEVTTNHPYFAFTDAERTPWSKIRWHLTELLDDGPALIAGNAITEFGGDVVLTQNLTGLGLRFARTLRSKLGNQCRMIHTVRDYGLICVRNTCYHNGTPSCGVMSPCKVKQALSRAYLVGVFDGVVGLTSAVHAKHTAVGLFGGTPSRIIHNTVPEVFLRTKTTDVTIGFGYLGSLTEEKGVLDLVEAYRLAYSVDNSIGPLLLAGQGSPGFEATLRDRSTDLPVELLGRVKPTELFNRVATLVVPSRWDEPFGRVVIEGASAGLRLVLSDRGGIAEAASSVRNLARGPSVAEFEGGNIRALASCLLDANRLAPFELDSGSESPHKVGEDYLDFVDSLAPGPRSGAAGLDKPELG